jgi:hypothetical protein
MKLFPALLSAITLTVAQSSFAQGSGDPGDPGDPGSTAPDYHRLFWDIEGASYSALSGKTAVLVRGDGATLPAVSWVETATENGPVCKWVLKNGIVQAIASESSFGYFNGSSSDGFGHVPNSNAMYNGDYYLTIGVNSWRAEDPPGFWGKWLYEFVGLGKWASETPQGDGIYVSPDGIFAYQYYMFIFDTTGNIAGENLAFSGPYAESLYDGTPNGVPEIQKEVIAIGGMGALPWDALVLRFNLNNKPLQESSKRTMLLIN